MTEVAAVAAWLGGAVIILADGRKGLAAGLTLMAAGLAGLALAMGQPFGAIALLAGGGAAAAFRFRGGPEGWGLMQPGSTPRLILTVVAGLLALWVGASVAGGDGTPLRVAVLASMGMLAARLLQEGERAVALSVASGLALVLGAASGMAPADPGPAPYVFAALIAAGLSALPATEPHGA